MTQETAVTLERRGHLLLIGAYRDNEVGPAHPLTHKLEVIQQSGKQARHIFCP